MAIGNEVCMEQVHCRAVFMEDIACIGHNCVLLPFFQGFPGEPIGSIWIVGRRTGGVFEGGVGDWKSKGLGLEMAGVCVP